MIAFARYLPITPALPVTSETCPLPLDYSNPLPGAGPPPMLSCPAFPASAHTTQAQGTHAQYKIMSLQDFLEITVKTP